MRVAQFLSEQHANFETVVHPPAYTSQKRARFLHIPGRHVVKSILLACGDQSILAVLSAPDHVDLAAIARHLGKPARLASELEVASLFRDCECGALTPFGSLYGIPTLLEESIDPDSTIIFESQEHAVAIKMRCRDFEMLERPRRCGFRLGLHRESPTA